MRDLSFGLLIIEPAEDGVTPLGIEADSGKHTRGGQGSRPSATVCARRSDEGQEAVRELSGTTL